MICPQCGAEYRPGFFQCVDCEVALVEDEPEEEEESDEPPIEESGNLDLVTVFESGDSGLIAIAKSLLDAAEIPFIVKGEVLQDLFGWGRFPGRMNLAMGPVEFQVDRADASDAIALLQEIKEALPEGPEPQEEEPPR